MGKMQAVGAVSGVIAKAGGKALLKCKKASPELLLAGGIVCGVAALVAAVCCTKKAMQDETLGELSQELDDIQVQEEEALKAAEADGVLKEARKDILVESRKASLRTYGKVCVRCAKIFAPVIIFTVASVGLTLASHGVLKARYAGAVAAYTALDESFKDYRKRNAAIIGEEAERKFYNGVQDVTVERVDEETGKKKKETVAKKVTETKKSPYEFEFDKSTAPLTWSPNQDRNFTFLRQVQSYLNDKFHAQGHLFMNEALDELGMERTQAGALVGWVVGGDGDGFVDLGFTEYYTDEYCDIHGLKSIHLNMNVDGVIYDKI